MSDDNFTNEIQGLPIELLIGAPLKAAAHANTLLAEEMVKFVENVGYETDRKTRKQKVRSVAFEYNKPEVDQETGEVVPVAYEVNVPLLSLVPLPNLQVKTVDVEFDMEILSVSSDTEEDNEKGNSNRSLDNISIIGKASTHREHSRKSDNGAKYEVKVHAETTQTPEVLARILDLMASSVAPVAKTK